MHLRIFSYLRWGIAISYLGLQATFAQSTGPVGQITVTPQVVPVGGSPVLTWSITTPSQVKDLISISGTGSLTASKNLRGEVRVLGVGITSQFPNGGTQYYQTMAQMRFNGATSWTTIFDGLHTDPVVQSLGVVKNFNINIAQGNTIHFGARFRANNTWNPYRNTTTGNHFVALTNGDACPPRIPANTSPQLKDFLKPYIDSSNKVKIGPMDVIVFVELTHTDPANAGFDGQDLVLLITFQAP